MISVRMRTFSVLLVALAVVAVSAMAVPLDDEVAQVFGQRIDWCRVACGVPGQPPSVIGIMACSRCCNGWCTLDSKKCKCP